MIDRKKVIKGLEYCSTSGVCPEQCPYYTDDGDNCQMYLDALALLKEQEPVSPEKQSDGKPGSWASWLYVCGACGQEIDYHDRFCRSCGREVKWE